jgi:uncharacterized protein YukE
MVGGRPFRAAVNSDLGALGAQVTPENVVHVSNVLQAEADHLRAKLNNARRTSVVGEPGRDPVSKPTAEGFNAKITALVDQLQAYTNQLEAAAQQLAQTAKSYGHTDQEIADSLSSIKQTYGKGPSAPLMTPDPVSPTGSLLRPYLPPTTRAPGDLRPLKEPMPTEWTPLVPPSGGPR